MRFFLLTLALFLSACASKKTLFAWGHYEDLIYTSYTKPGSVSPEMEIDKLQADLEKARAAGKPVHPGFHAHLGYAYFQIGKMDLARQEFLAEKKLFPESGTLMDRFLAKLKR